MKTLYSILLILFISLLSSPSWSETVSYIDDLVNRGGLYYKKFTDVPFTGEVSGQFNGKFENGRMDGRWVTYYESGELSTRYNYRLGKRFGSGVAYHINGQIRAKATFKDEEYHGFYEQYHRNGRLNFKGNFINGKREDGIWKVFDENGILFEFKYKNGELVSK